MSDKKVILLRPHHGLCLCFFEGYGYSDAFNRNMAAVLQSLEANTRVRIAKGQDCICANCPNQDTGCPNAALYDQSVRSLCGLSEGQELSWSELCGEIRRHVLEAGRLQAVCGNCKWYYICGNKKPQFP